jgi:hypothetical protein
MLRSVEDFYPSISCAENVNVSIKDYLYEGVSKSFRTETITKYSLD